tara:strand:- start:17931 stop:19520 length:1590 start_codon:yes stop_codon:yes gene_type:complete
MKRRRSFSRGTIIFLFTILFLSFVKIDFRLNEITNGLISDDSAYYYHAQTIGVDNDLDYANQLEGTDKRNLNLENSKPVPVHPIGVGFLAGPFLFISNILNNLIGIDSVVSFNYFVYSLVPIFYLFLGIFLMNKVITKKVGNVNYIKTSLFVLGSGVTYYAFERFSMSHVYEFFSIIFLMYLCSKYEEKNLSSFEFLIPFVTFFFLLLRWSNYHLFLIPFFYFSIFNISSKKKLFMKPYYIFGFLAGAVLFLIHTKFLYGLYTFNPSNIFLIVENRLSENYEQLRDISQLPENILLSLNTLFIMLFSQEFGLFYFSPIIFIGFIFLIYFLYKKKFQIFLLTSFIYLFPFVAVVIYQNTSYSYGFRYMFSLIGINIFLYFRFFRKSKIINTYLVLFSIFGIFSQLMFETSQYTVLSIEYVENSFGQMTLYANPNYLSGVFKSAIIFDSYLNIVFTSFLGVIILKFISFFTDLSSFISTFRDIDDDIALLLSNTNEISWFYLLMLFFTLYIFIKVLSRNISFDNFKEILKI